MTNIENEVFVHIHTLHDNSHTEKWQVGNTLDFGVNNRFNSFYESITNPYIDLNREKVFIENLTRGLCDHHKSQSFENVNMLFLKKGMLNTYVQFTRELVFEEVRKRLFPEKPSRINSIWLAKVEYIEKWKKTFLDFNLQFKIFLIKFSGKVHKADGRWLTNIDSPHAFDNYFRHAIAYWTGEIFSEFGEIDEEFVGAGYVEILREMA